MTMVLAVSGITCALFGMCVLGGGKVAGIVACAAGLLTLVFRLIARKMSLQKQVKALVSGGLTSAMLVALLFAGASGYAAKTAALEFAAVDRLLLQGGVEESAKALELLKEMEEKYPNSMEIYIRQAQANSQMFKDSEAEYLLGRCANEGDIRYYLMKASEEIKAGEEVKARDTYVEAAARYPQNFQIQFNTGFLCYTRGDLTIAEFYLLRACALNPKEPNALFFLGSIKASQGDYAAAREHLHSAAVLTDDGALKQDIENLMASLPPEGA